MTIYFSNYRTASLRLVSRWDFGCRKFRTCYIVQVGPLWLTIDRKASDRRSNAKLCRPADSEAGAQKEQSK